MILRVLGNTEAVLPAKWHNYIILNIPEVIPNVFGEGIRIIEKLIQEETVA
jgi:hypothetical protein